MNLHLKENDLLREILNLGNKVTTLPPALYKQNKIERVSNDDSLFTFYI